MRCSPFAAGIIAASLMFLAVPSARAADGQIDILPDGATTYVIDTPGSYVLVDNIQMTAAVTCIEITADEVSLDLNGHTIAGVGLGGSENGIDGSAAINARISNGTVRAFGGHGLKLGHLVQVEKLITREHGGDGLQALSQAHLSGVRAQGCKGWGLATGDLAVVENCTVTSSNQNGNAGGINVGAVAVVRGSQARSNQPIISGNLTSVGIKAGDRAQVVNNSCYLNGCGGSSTGIGIQVGNLSAVVSNVSNANVGDSMSPGAISIGISALDGCEIIDNHAHANRVPSTVGGGQGFGIVAADRCLIRGNSCDNNSGEAGVSSIGIQVSDGCRVEDNHCSLQINAGSNFGILVNGTDNKILRNTTGLNTTAGIRLVGSGNYFAENILSDTLSNLGSNTAGTGDRSNVPF